MEVDKIIWDVDFAKVQEEFEPLSANLKLSDTPPLRYNCEGKVLVWSEQGTAGRAEPLLIWMGLSSGLCIVRGF